MALTPPLKKYFPAQKWITILLSVVGVLLITAVGYSIYLYTQNVTLKVAAIKNATTIEQVNKEIADIKAKNPYKNNLELKKQIDNLQKTFANAVTTYENLLDLENPPKEIKGLDTLFANVLTLLGKQDFAGAEKSLTDIANKIAAEQTKAAAAPSSGSSSKQQVATDVGNFLIDIVAGDSSSTRVIVDTTSDST